MPDSAFRRRIAPFSTVEISFTDAEGEFRKRYRLAFNLNVLAEISEKTGRESKKKRKVRKSRCATQLKRPEL